MKTYISMIVDVSDLDIDYKASRESDVTEMWGRVETHEFWDVQIKGVKFNGVELEEYDYEEIVDWIIQNELEG